MRCIWRKIWGNLEESGEVWGNLGDLWGSWYNTCMEPRMESRLVVIEPGIPVMFGTSEAEPLVPQTPESGR